jgi:hypothetical protein
MQQHPGDKHLISALSGVAAQSEIMASPRPQNSDRESSFSAGRRFFE